jgi:hypothetical protein
MTSNDAAPAPCDDRGEGRVADRLGGAISNLPSPSPQAWQHIDLRRPFLAFDNAFPLLASLRAQLPDSCRHCGSKIATIARGRGPHAAEKAGLSFVSEFTRSCVGAAWRRARSHRGRAGDGKPTMTASHGRQQRETLSGDYCDGLETAAIGAQSSLPSPIRCHGLLQFLISSN